jgi:oligoendopeptidase F
MLKVKKTEWDLSPLFKNDNDPKMKKEQKEILKVNNAFVKKWKDRTDYLEDPKVLAEALNEAESLETEFGTSGNQGYYFHLRSSQELNNSKIKAKLNKINDLDNKLSNESMFFDLGIAKIDPKLHNKILSHPDIKPFKHALEKTFENAKYILSEPEEKILNLKSQTSHSNWQRMNSEFTSKIQGEVTLENGEKKTSTFEELLTLCQSPKKKIRDEAGQLVNNALSKLSEISEHEINSILQNKKINDELRGFSRPDQPRHIGDDISTEVVDALVGAVSKEFKTSQKFYKLKAKLLKQKKLEYYEKTVKDSQIDKEYSYSDAVNLVHTTFNNLDPEFAKIFEDFVNNGQIDVYPKHGKRGGAFCTHNTKNNPTYVLLNYTNKLTDTRTIAHEMGHAINNEFMRKVQPETYFDTPLSTAEVASTFMEDFVNDEILKTADDELKFAILMNNLGDSISTIHRQIACYNFETDLHKESRARGYLSKDEIGTIFIKHMDNYLGSAINTKGAKDWWTYWSHIRVFFYVYSYASGLLISKALQRKVKQDPTFIEKVKIFLSTGSSESPTDTFMKMGIDITKKEFWQEGLKEIKDQLKEAEKLAKKLKKI